MYSVIRRYQGDAKALDDLATLVNESAREIMMTIPGLVTYTFVVDGKGGAASVGFFDDKAGADESTKRAAEFVRQRAANLRLNPPSVQEGTVRLRKTSGTNPEFGVLRTYKLNPGSFDETLRRAEQELVPMITQARGFATYNVIDTGHDTLVSASSFATRQDAEDSTRQTAEWVKQNLSTFAPNPPEVWSGQMKVRWTK
jgi:hypothetical protein